MTTLSGGFTYRTPLVGTLEDLGAPIPDTSPQEFATFVFVAAITDGNTGTQRDDDCAALVGGIDFTTINQENTIINIFEDEESATLAGAVDYISNNTPNTLGWTQGKFNSVVNRGSNFGVDTSGWTRDTTLLVMANDSAQLWSPGFDFAQAVTTRTGA